MIVTEKVGSISVSYEINNDEDLKLYEKFKVIEEESVSGTRPKQKLKLQCRNWFSINPY